MEINHFIYVAMALVFVLQCTLAQLTFTVSKDGLGNFTTIAQAVAAAPNNNPRRTFIKIKAGVYDENVIISPHKTNLYFIGEGMNNTKITGHRSTSMHLRTFQTSTVRIDADGFIARGISFENTAGPKLGQAVALRSSGNLTAFYQCRFTGYQDTLNANLNVQFYRDCEIYGTVDFIYGDSRAVFQNCKIYARRPLVGQSNTITAHGRESPQDHSGYVMHNCTISGTPDLMKNLNVKNFLGRPWRNHSTTVVMQSFLDKIIDPRGWLEMGTSLDKVYYAEFNNRGPGSSTNHRVNWSHVIYSRAEAAKYTVRNFIDGELWLRSTGIPFYLDLL